MTKNSPISLLELVVTNLQNQINKLGEEMDNVKESLIPSSSVKSFLSLDNNATVYDAILASISKGFRGFVIFDTVGSHTFLGSNYGMQTPTPCIILVKGGGGGGASGEYGNPSVQNSRGNSGGGGNGGDFNITYTTLQPNENYTVIIGAGGSGGKVVTSNYTNCQPGTKGGDTTFGTFLKASGGDGALGMQASKSTSNFAPGGDGATDMYFGGGGGGGFVLFGPIGGRGCSATSSSTPAIYTDMPNGNGGGAMRNNSINGTNFGGNIGKNGNFHGANSGATTSGGYGSPGGGGGGYGAGGGGGCGSGRYGSTQNTYGQPGAGGNGSSGVCIVLW